MAGTYKPIAGLSPDNQGPTDTIVSIFLAVTTVFFSSIRFAIGRRRLLQLDSDDAAFGVALCFGVAMSVVSNISVSAGLGRHQDALEPEDVDRYFKLFYTTQFLGIVALASAKLSVVLLFRRIVPAQQAPHTLKILIPVITSCAVLAIFLVGFQCQLPTPWMLNPKTCSTHGYVYYPITILNIVTDLALAGWILPAIWALQMRRSTKLVVIALFASRLVVSIVDVGRLVVIHQALQSDDQTWSELPWAILDQIVIHLSINHATLPRIHVFLGNMQTGLLTTRLTTNEMNTTSKGSKGSKGNRTDGSDTKDGSPLNTAAGRSRSGSNPWAWGKKALASKSRSRAPSTTSTTKILKPSHGARRIGQNKEASISEKQLNLQPEQGIEMSTSIYAGDGESASSQDGKAQNRDDWGHHVVSAGRSVPAYSKENAAAKPGGAGSSSREFGGHGQSPSNHHINVWRTVEMRREPADAPRRGEPGHPGVRVFR